MKLARRKSLNGRIVGGRSQLGRALLVTAVLLCLVAPSASAHAVPDRRLGGVLGDLWTTVLQTPTPQNPFAGGDPCVDLGNILAPLAPGAVESCTVKRGTKIFVSAWTTECSTFEGNGSTETELLTCARAADQGFTTHTIAVDGQPVPVREVQTELLHVRLPLDNIFGLTGEDRSGLSVAHGWVTLVKPLSRGTHTIEIHLAGTDASGVPFDRINRTTIIVL